MLSLKNQSNQFHTTPAWTFGQKILFRFFFIYLVLQMIAWYFSFIPFSSYVTQYYDRFIDWLVHFANNTFFIYEKYWFILREVAILHGAGRSNGFMCVLLFSDALFGL